MKTSDFYYDLPQELIAQTPLDKRDTSRLMTLDRASGAVEHHLLEQRTGNSFVHLFLSSLTGSWNQRTRPQP